MKSLLASLLLLLICSCQSGKRQSSHDTSASGDTIRMKYSRLLTMVRHDHYTLVHIANPWRKGTILHSYVLTDSSYRGDLPDATRLNIPLRRMALFSTVQTSLMVDLGRSSSIAAVADRKYIKTPLPEGIADVGDSMNPDIERLMSTCADALFVSPFQNSGGYGKVGEIGIPVVECADYMEPSPLARAEWIRFYGMLVGAEQKAEEWFQHVDSSYQSLKSIAAKASSHPKVNMDKMTGNVWYVPGGKSTIGHMISDAGIRYPFADDQSAGSLSLSLESVMEHAADAPLWLFRYDQPHDITYAELASEHRAYNLFDAFRHRNCYGCNVMTTRFYEETPFRPDLLLNDFIVMAHPEIDQLQPLRYFKKVRE